MKKSFGFTLIELMIVVAVVAILAGLAFGAYNKQVRKSRRAEAKQVLSDLALRQEKWRSNNAAYFGTDSSVAEIASFGTTGTSSYYTIAVTSTESATAHTATATPTGDQVKDSCGTLGISMAAGTLSKTPTTAGCW